MSKVSSHFQSILKKRTGSVCELAKMGLQELKMIVQNAESYGVQVSLFYVCFSIFDFILDYSLNSS